MTLTVEELNERCTYATPDEIAYMREKMVPRLGFQENIVMIGAGPGVLLFPLLETPAWLIWRVFVIDLNTVQYAKEHLSQGNTCVANAAENITWFEGVDSYHVGKSWDLGPVDFLIVDGDHSDRGVRRDMEAWLPHIAHGGYVFFHDYEYTGTQWEGQDLVNVKPAVDEVMNEEGWEVVDRVGSSIIFKKR